MGPENELRNRKHKKNKHINNGNTKSNSSEKLVNEKQFKNEINYQNQQEEKITENVENSRENIENRTENINVEKVDSKTDLVNKFDKFRIHIEIDIISLVLFFIALSLRLYRLEEPRNIVFDELHYGKYVSLYMKRTFFFDTNPPLGKQMVAAVAYLAGYDGNCTFDRIGYPYPDNVPVFALRLVPAICGSLIIPIAYNIMLEIGLTVPSAALAGLLIVCDNALLTQSRFILMESMLIMFSLFGVLCVLYFRKYYDRPYCLQWYFWLMLTFASFTCALCIKYTGIYAMFLGIGIIAKMFWDLLANPQYSDRMLQWIFIVQIVVSFCVSALLYLAIFYVHLQILTNAGPHDSVMTSAFQASLEGGLASITKGQPLYVSHGSQITLRHTYGTTCWLHSHQHVYPLRYSDRRGSSHQQQVTCYSYKDVNNWWLVKRPEKNDLVVRDPIDVIRHDDIIQLVHGITSRALNSHDVAAPMSPQCQEVSCYIDYNVSMPAQNLWRVEIVNRDQFGDEWQTIQSHVRLIHVNSSLALTFSGRQLPEWGFYQHEVVADKLNNLHNIWNVEEHRYTKSDDQKERERQLVTAEMIPTKPTKLSFWSKFKELQRKMLFLSTSYSADQSHMYGSEPFEWPLMTRGIAYWISNTSNAQIHLLGNIVLWYSATISILIYSALLIFYLLRRQRNCYDIPEDVWKKFVFYGELFFGGYLCHYIPYFFVERILFLHHYLPALVFKLFLMVALIDHLHYLLKYHLKLQFIQCLYICLIFCWSLCVIQVFLKFIVLSYGLNELTANDILNLRWKDTWDFIIHRQM